MIWHTHWFQRFWDVVGAASVRVKVMGIVIGVIVLLGLFVGMQMRGVLYNTLETALMRQGIDLAHFVLERVDRTVEAGDPEALRDELLGLQDHYSGNGHNTLIDYVLVTGNEGEIIATTADQAAPVLPPVAPDTMRARNLVTVWGDVIDVAAALPGGAGELRIGLGEDNIEQIVQVVTTQIVTITLAMIAVGFAAAAFLTWILTRPISSLVEATRTVEAGDYSVRVPRWAKDEIGELAEAFNAMTRSLAQAERERRERDHLRANYIRGVITAQEDERKRIARELHDSTSQALTSLLVSLRQLEQTQDARLAQQRIGEIRSVVNNTLDEVHALAWQLRPTVLDDLGLTAALQRYIEDYQRRFNVQVDFVFRHLGERLPVELETTLYRVIQEGLTNIARHASARNASILLEGRPGCVRLIVEDNGVGFDAGKQMVSQKNLGLQGIRERVTLLGGSLTIESQPGQGTSLFVEIPLIPVAPDAQPKEVKE